MWAGHTRVMVRSVVIGHSVHGAVRVCSESRFSSSAPVDMWACQELLAVMRQELEGNEVGRPTGCEEGGGTQARVAARDCNASRGTRPAPAYPKPLVSYPGAAHSAAFLSPVPRPAAGGVRSRGRSP